MTDRTFDSDNAPLPVVDLVSLCAELGRIVVIDPVGAVLQRIVDLAVEVIPEAEQVSVTLIERGRARSEVVTGDLAARLDERQYSDGFGPCMQAAVTGGVITVEDTAGSVAYPWFGREADRHGINRTLSAGMATLPPAASGSINIYSATPSGPFPQIARDLATTFASYAAIALVNATSEAAALDEADQLRQAMISRASIEQAKGVLMHDRQCTAEEAFAILRDLSSQSNRKLRDVAQVILDNASPKTS